jgi:hypothetical protein
MAVAFAAMNEVYGPLWQIEALRRLEIPEAMRNKHGFAQLGAADGATQRQILGQNAARLHELPAWVGCAPPSLPRTGLHAQ